MNPATSLNSFGKLLAILPALVALVFPYEMCHAQLNYGVVNGTVADQSAAGVPGASVTISSPTTGFSRTVQTGSYGTYAISNLNPGIYTMSAEASGFKKAVVATVTLNVGQTVTQDFNLQVGDIREEVSVTAEAPLLNTTNNQLGTVITNQHMTQLPLNGRNFLQLNLLSPGVVRGKYSNTFEAVEINPTATSFSVSGQKSDYNMFLIDGVIMKESMIGTNSFSPSIDAVQEFQTTTSNYSAAFGSEAGAQVNLALKTGTNKFHGAVWEFLRNDKLDARSFFQVGPVPPFKRNAFGGNVGGPIIREKTFFMFNYEGLRQAKQLPYFGLVPTPAQLAGDLSGIVTANKPLVDPFSGQPFTNNIIPEDRIRPAGLLEFLQTGIGNGPWVPIPNLEGDPTRNYFRNDTNRFSSNQYISRIDHRLSSNTMIYGHVVFNRESLHQPQTNPNWWIDYSKKSLHVAGHASHVFSPNLLFDVAGGFSGFTHDEVQSTAFKNDITNQVLKIQGNATIPESWGPPSWGASPYINLGGHRWGPRLWISDTFHLRPTFTWNTGRHNLQWGMDFQRRKLDFQEIFITNGIYGFDGRFTGYPLGDFLLDLPARITSSPDPFAPDYRLSAFGPYFQDDWKVTRDFTLNFGLRYEWTGVPFSNNNRSQSNLYFPPDGASPKLVIADDAAPIKFHGVQATFFEGIPFERASSLGLPQPLAFNDNKNLAPRFGFAYRIPKLSNTVVRGGYGIFYQNDIADKWVEAAISAPFVRTNATTLDATNFQDFDPNNPYAQANSTAVQVFWNQVNHRQAMLQAWNLTMERTVLNTLVSVAYVGNTGRHLANLENPNQAVPGPGAIADRRRWSDWGVLAGAGENGSSNYHSLQAKVQRTLAQGFSFLLGYTYSKCIDDTGGTYVGEGERAAIQNYADRSNSRGLCGQDIRQRLVVSYVYELPFGNGKRFLNGGGATNWILGGWQINGITTASSGSPSTPFQTFNVANTDVGSMRPDVIGDPNDISHSRPRGDQVAMFFNTSAFQLADLTNSSYRFGNAGRNIIIGPGTYVYDFSLYKSFRIREEIALQFRAEFFNLFNRPIFGKPGGTFGTPAFGRLTTTTVDPRDIQFGLKLTW